MRSRFSLLFALGMAALLLVGCNGPLDVPPTPTPDPKAGPVLQNHQHGEGGPNGRLITRYGGPVAVDVATQPANPAPTRPFTITYTLNDKNGKPVTGSGLTIVHERLMHLIVVSQDLTNFAHIHPVDEGNGSYVISDTVPSGGKYLMYNEFTTADGITQIERDVLATDGAGAADTPASLTPDIGTKQEVDGVTAQLTTNSPKIRRRIPTHFFLDVSKNGQPVTDLEPFLGAPCHIVIISADTKQFDHTHGDVPGGAMAGDMTTMNMATMALPTPPAHFGPQIQFTHTFMQPGAYRIWVQFGHDGKVVTVPYNVIVVN
ncbi:MAG: hypothetical protein ABI670_23130 [Chloroflexota bacterium]